MMDMSPRSQPKGRRFVLPFSNSLMKKTNSGWLSSAPGIAKRQSNSEWLSGRKTLGEYSRIPKLSPTNDNCPGGRLSQMSSSSGRSSTSGLYDADPNVEERENCQQNPIKNQPFRASGNQSDEESDNDAGFAKKAAALKSADVSSLEASSRVAQRLASTSSPPSAILRTTVNLISFKEEHRPEEGFLVDTGQSDTSIKKNGNNFNANKLTYSAPPTSSSSSAGIVRTNGFLGTNVRPKTSLEAIRQQIRQIESEIRISNTKNNKHHATGGHEEADDLDSDDFIGISRPIQASYSSQSIPANFNSTSERNGSASRQRNGNKFHPHMQRAQSVDVAVHSAISDIQSAVRRSSMIRLKSSTTSLHQAGIEEEEDNIWIKRDSSAQTEMQEEEVEETETLPCPTTTRLHSTNMSPDMDEEIENESMGLLLSSQENSTGCDSNHHRIGNISMSRPISAPRRSSCQNTHNLIEGELFRCCYLGSTHLFSDSRPTKSSRLNQAQEAVTRIKAPDGESQPMTDVDLFISMEKIMVLNVDIQDVLMDHPLRTISYIADIGDLVVLMVKRGLEDLNCDVVLRSTQPKMLCHVFQSIDASNIAQTIGQGFQVAYMEYLKANGIQDDRYLRHLDYLEVLNSQEMSTNELDLFASKDKQINVVIPKQKGEILGVVIVESGWGSMLPTVIIANLCPTGPGARSGKLSIGDQLISIDGISLVGLPLAQCQSVIKNVKNHTVVKLTIVSCPPVVEVKIKRPDTRYQLGFSVQNGIICSLLRGGIAERGGIRVGHRIIEINSQSVVATTHDMIVSMLAHSVGEIELKTMPSSIFRLLTGQDAPVYI